MNTPISAELKGHFLRLFEMALTDGDFSTSELKMLYHFAEERDIPREELDGILLSTSTFQIPDEISTRIEYLYDLSKMIWADGVVTDDEMTALKKYCRKFEFLPENIEELAQYLIDAVRDGRSKLEILQEIEN